MNPIFITLFALALIGFGLWSIHKVLSRRREGKVVVAASAATGSRHGRRQQGFIRADRSNSGRNRKPAKSGSGKPGVPQKKARGPIRKPWGW